MGLFSDLFSPAATQDERIPAIMPPGANAQIRQGIIPTMRTDRIVLSSGESCHFSERAIMVTEKRGSGTRDDQMDSVFEYVGG